MKISIDTKEDSVDEIRKAINMLNHIIAENASMETTLNAQPLENQEAPAAEPVQEGLFNMFNDAPTDAPQHEPPEVDHTTYRVSQEEKKVDFSGHVVPYD